jgi:predicted DNA-binding transcriptional regulator AlpA
MPAPLPFIPRALSADLAALYCGVSVSWWRAAAKEGRAPAPLRITDRKPVWLREDLDNWLDAQRAGGPSSGPTNPWDAPPDANRAAQARP